MIMPQYPVVTLLSPSHNLLTEHHGPRSQVAGSLPDTKPDYFLNPWRSYHPASLSDAWLAYQRGAAIAPAPIKLAKSSHISSLASVTDDAELENEPLAGRKRRGYVRPEFSLWHEDDHEDDWRDPPVEVVAPRWDEEKEKSAVTWLGHAGVLIQIPWQRTSEAREDMCGVIYDPIFSYRSVGCSAHSRRRCQWPLDGADQTR